MVIARTVSNITITKKNFFLERVAGCFVNILFECNEAEAYRDDAGRMAQQMI